MGTLVGTAGPTGDRGTRWDMPGTRRDEGSRGDLRWRRVSGRAGFSILELLIALTVLVAALVGFSQAIVGAGNLATSSRENALANEAARSLLEELRTTPIEEGFLRYNDDPGDDAGLVVPGPHFDVPGLEPVPGDPDGLAGRVLFPVDPNDPGVLLEDLQDPGANLAFGLPLDLNGDAFIDFFDHAPDYELLPVVVRIEWRSGSLEVRTILGDMR